MKKYLATCLALLFLLTNTIGCQFNKSGVSGSTNNSKDDIKLEKFTASFLNLFDTVTYVIGYAETEEDFNKITEEIHKELEDYHKLYDIYKNYDGINNIKTINDNAGIKPVEVDTKIIDLLEFGKKAYDETDGLTNMAMGSVLKIWHKYREDGIDNPQDAKLPTEDELEQAAKHIDISKVIIDKENSTVFLEDPEMSLDVGSLGKGYAVERVSLKLSEDGYNNILISVGGNVKAVGKKPNGDFWEVGIENPYGKDDFMGIALMDNNALVISGNYQRYYTVDGERYHHIINPKTYMPENYMAAVAVLCPDSGLADAYTTALFNKTPEEGKKWAEAHNIEAMWMLNDETVIYSSGFEKELKKI